LIIDVLKDILDILGVGLLAFTGLLVGVLFLGVVFTSFSWLVCWLLYRIRGDVPPTWKHLWEIAGSGGGE